MSTTIAFVIVALFAMSLMTVVVILALRTSRRVKASAKIGKGSFDIETIR